MLPRRLRSSWILLAISSFGILAAVTLMAIAAIYSRALAEGGLRHTMATTSPNALNTQIYVRNRPLGPADYQKVRSTVEGINDTRLGFMTRETQRLVQAQPNLPVVRTPGRSPPPGSPLGRPFFLTEFENYSTLLEGRWPRAIPLSPDEALELEVVVGTQTAIIMNFEVGSVAYIVPFSSDPSEAIALRVVGIAEAADPGDEYWFGLSFTYFRTQDYDDRVLAPLYVTEEAFFGGLGTRYPSLVGDYGWFLYLDTDVLTADIVGSTKDAIVGLETDVNKHFPRSYVFSTLENTLRGYEKELSYARVPLFLFISLIVLIIVYFLSLVMGLLARTQSDEASLLRSRGASIFQVGGLLALGEGLAVVLAMAVGPFLGLAIVRYLFVGTINPAGDSGTPPIGISADMFIMGAIGGLLSLVTLMASSLGLARLGMVEFLRVRARPPTVPLLQRYYVDLLVLAGVGLLLWQIEVRGGVIGRDVVSGAVERDFSLLLGPVLVLLAAALLVLRLLPPLIRSLAWGTGRLAPAWVSFALLRVARDPLHYGSLAIILMMAATLGVIGATFQSTLSRSQRDQALYTVGGDMVVNTLFFFSSSEGLIANTPGVDSVSPVGRATATLLDGFPGMAASLLTINPDSLPKSAWFRDDFAGESLPELLSPLKPQPTALQDHDMAQGILLPDDAEKLGVWVNLDKFPRTDAYRGLALWVRLHDAQGRYASRPLGDFPSLRSRPLALAPGDGGQVGQGVAGDSPFPRWTYFEGALPVSGSPFVETPLRVVSLFISGDAPSTSLPGTIGLDDLTVIAPSIPGSGRVIEGYEWPGLWVTLPNAGDTVDTIVRTEDAAHSGEYGINFSWQDSVGGVPRGILIPPGRIPIPAIGGPTFHVGQQVRLRMGKQVVPVEVHGVTDYFPTLRLRTRPFLLVSVADYSQFVRRVPEGRTVPPGEFWVSLEPGADRDETRRSITDRLRSFVSVEDRDASVDLALRNPLGGGGWSGLTILGISVLTVAVVLALGAHVAVSVRTGRIDLTVARALGFSRRQLFQSVALETLIVAAIGIAAGAGVGFGLAWWTLGFLDITPAGNPKVPPMVTTVHHWLMALVFLELAAALALAIVFSTVAARRLRVPDVLKAG